MLKYFYVDRYEHLGHVFLKDYVEDLDSSFVGQVCQLFSTNWINIKIKSANHAKEVGFGDLW